MNLLRLLSNSRKTKIGIYVDAFNLYYGAKTQMGTSSAGWRWLDFPTLLNKYIDANYWPKPIIVRIVYCTALRTKEGDPTSLADQENYIKALKHSYPNMQVEYGKYSKRTKTGILFNKSGKGKRIESLGLANIPANLPIKEKHISSTEIYYSCSISTFEEKGSDVNVATHLLRDMYAKEIDAAIVVSNDSDLRLPIALARKEIRVGLVNPTSRATSRELMGNATDGVGGHWWHKIPSVDFLTHQLPSPVGAVLKPQNW